MFSILSPLLLFFSLLAQVDALPSKYELAGADLDPIHPDDFEVATGLAKRDDLSPFEFLSPASQSHLTYGRPASDTDQFMTSNMTLLAPKGSMILTLERFEGLTSAIDCQGTDGEISVTFNVADAFHHAVEKWSYINDDENASFIAVTNHDGCGDEYQRQPYRVSKVLGREDTLRMVMKVEHVEWQEIATDFDLHFGEATLAPDGQNELRRRGLKMMPAGTKKFSHGKKNNNILIFKDPTRYPPRFKLTCESCFIKGTFKAMGAFKVSHGVPVPTGIVLTIESFHAMFDFLFELVMEHDRFPTDAKDSIKYNKKRKPFKFEVDEELLDFPVPYLSIKIPKIFNFGVSLVTVVFKELQMFGRIKWNMGVEIKFKKGPRLYFDHRNPSKSKASGFSKAMPDFFFRPKEGNIEANLLGYFGPRIDIGLEIFGTEFELQTQMRSPSINANLTMGYDKDGFCNQKKGDKKTGIKLALGANLQLWTKIPKPDMSIIGPDFLSMFHGLSLPDMPDWNDLPSDLSDMLPDIPQVDIDLPDVNPFNKRSDDHPDGDLEDDLLDEDPDDGDLDDKYFDDEDLEVEDENESEIPSQDLEARDRKGGKHRGERKKGESRKKGYKGKHRGKSKKGKDRKKGYKGKHRKEGKHRKPKKKQSLKPKIKNIYQNKLFNSKPFVAEQLCFPIDLPFVDDPKKSTTKKVTTKTSKSSKSSTSSKTTSAETTKTAKTTKSTKTAETTSKTSTTSKSSKTSKTSKHSKTPAPTITPPPDEPPKPTKTSKSTKSTKSTKSSTLTTSKSKTESKSSKSSSTSKSTHSPSPTPSPGSDEYKTKGCKITASALRHRKCPSTSKKCPALGQYPKGKRLKFKCKVNGEYVKDDKKSKGTKAWGKDTEGNYLSLAYVEKSCAKHIPKCKGKDKDNGKD